VARRAVILSLLLIGLLAGAAGAGALWAWSRAEAPGPSTAETVVVIPPGTGVAGIAARLEDATVIASPLLFRLTARVMGADTALRAGEYAFPAAVSIVGALALLESGRTVARYLTVPEGLTTAEVLALVNGADAMTGLATAADAGGEGRLLPETYHYSYGDDRGALVRRMADAMDAALAEVWAARPDGFPLDGPAQLSILASIVEKETAVAQERPMVAAVFLNRLRRGMRLQSDPTVVYGLTGGAGPLGRALTRDDLAREHAYNTYAIPGLPPTPIANPGRASLDAVVHPAETDALYFVADGTGGHVFADTLEAHNRNVAKWRRLQRNAK
jgi:UPF0755 protein